MGNWYVPSIKVRKLQSGHPCPGCSLLMHHGDMVAWSTTEGTVFLHDKCAEIILDIAAEEQYDDVIPEENSGAGTEAKNTPGPAEETGPGEGAS